MPLSNLHDSAVLKICGTLHQPTNYKKRRISHIKKCRVVLIGDSRVTGFSERISNLLGDSYSVIGITKPDANLKAITSSFNLKTEDYTMNYDVVICGGTIDVGRNETNTGL
jgi:hypothetical protein